MRENFTADLIQAEVDIRLRHPLLSLVKPWMDKQLREVKVKSACVFVFLSKQCLLILNLYFSPS